MYFQARQVPGILRIAWKAAKMVRACNMLATDVGAVKGKDKAEWTQYKHISRQLQLPERTR